MKRRASYRRDLLVELECGHRVRVQTGYTRLTQVGWANVLGQIIGDGGIECSECNAVQHVLRPLRSVRGRRVS
jgi:hypothetical protein